MTFFVLQKTSELYGTFKSLLYEGEATVLVVQVLGVSVVFALVFVLITKVTHQVVSRKMKNQEQYEYARALVASSMALNASQREFALKGLVGKMAVGVFFMFLGRMEWMPNPAYVVWFGLSVAVYLYCAMALREFDEEGAFKTFEIELWGHLRADIVYWIMIAVIWDVMAIAMAKQKGSATTTMIHEMINIGSMAVVICVAIWVVLGGPRRIWDRIKEKLSKLVRRPMPAMART
jgi:hypothetical protein